MTGDVAAHTAATGRVAAVRRAAEVLRLDQFALVPVIVLAIELSRYQWDTSARSARQSVLGNRPPAVAIFRSA